MVIKWRHTVDLPLLKTLSAICQKSRQPILWEMIDSFLLLAYAIMQALAAPRTLLQRVIACLDFTDLFCW